MENNLHRVQREASDAEHWQWIKNVVRRLFLLPITRTSEQARREYMAGYLIGRRK